MLIQSPTTFLRPFHIGDVLIETPITLAPMADVTTQAFRRICKGTGAVGLVCTELLSSKAITYRSQKTFGMMAWGVEESPLAVQLFGNDPAIMAEAAQTVAELGAQIVDINMGCWVPKIAGKGAGAALLRDVCTATAVVKAVVDAVKIPVTVKVRAGFEMGRVTAVDFARAAQDVGVKMIAVHGRFAEQGFKGEADWSVIRRVKEVVSIPVLGNGDVLTPQDAERMFLETGVDGVMIGRGALGNPWIFPQIRHYLLTGEHLPPPSIEDRVLMALHHARLSVETSAFEEKMVCLQLRGQLPPYFVGIHGKARINDALRFVHSLKEVEDLLLGFLERQHEYEVTHA